MIGTRSVAAPAGLSRMLGCPVRLACSDDATALPARGPLREPGEPAGPGAWRRSRRALRLLMRDAPAPAAAWRLALPSPRYSVSHDGALAWALDLGAHACGAGLDVESGPGPAAGAERFYLRPCERALLERLVPGDRARARLWLWTIKEAVYKADPGNRQRMLLHYAIDAAGHAVRSDGAARFRWASVPWGAGFLSVARRV